MRILSGAGVVGGAGAGREGMVVRGRWSGWMEGRIWGAVGRSLGCRELESVLGWEVGGIIKDAGGGSCHMYDTRRQVRPTCSNNDSITNYICYALIGRSVPFPFHNRSIFWYFKDILLGLGTRLNLVPVDG